MIDALPKMGKSSSYILSVYVVLCRIAGKDGWIKEERTTLPQLEKRTGFSQPVILAALKALEERFQILQVVRTRGQKSRYRLLHTEDRAVADDHPNLFDDDGESDLEGEEPLNEIESYPSTTLGGTTQSGLGVPPSQIESYPSTTLSPPLNEIESSYIDVDSKTWDSKTCGRGARKRATPTRTRESSGKATTPPTPEEALAYFTELHRPDLAEDFCDKYQARGWTTFGGSPVPVTDWRAAARSWVRKQRQFEREQKLSASSPDPQSCGNTRPARRESDIDRVVREAAAKGLVEGSADEHHGGSHAR